MQIKYDRVRDGDCSTVGERLLLKVIDGLIVSVWSTGRTAV